MHIYTMQVLLEVSRVCEKLQAAIVNPNAINPNAINPMCLETTQSISSDEALAPSPPILLNSTDDTDESPINRHNGRPPHSWPVSILQTLIVTMELSIFEL